MLGDRAWGFSPFISTVDNVPPRKVNLMSEEIRRRGIGTLIMIGLGIAFGSLGIGWIAASPDGDSQPSTTECAANVFPIGDLSGTTTTTTTTVAPTPGQPVNASPTTAKPKPSTTTTTTPAAITVPATPPPTTTTVATTAPATTTTTTTAPPGP